MRPTIYLLLVLLIPGIARAQWTKLESGTTRNLNAVDLPMGVPIVVGDSGTVLKQIDALHWSSRVSGTSSNLYSVSFGNYTDGYAVGSHGTILGTTDAGESWTALNSGVSNVLFSVCAWGSGTAYAVGSAGTILKTIDGGITWEKQVSGLPETDNLYSVYFSSLDTGYAAGGRDIFQNSCSIILKSTNGGATWTRLFIGCSFYDNIGLASAAFYITGYAVGKHGTILQFTGEDSTVVRHTSGTSADLLSVCAGPDQTYSFVGYAVGQQGIILKRTKADTSWTRQASGTTENLNSVYFWYSDYGFAVGNNGTILMTNNGGGNGINDRPDRAAPLQIYPNPASAGVTIETVESARGWLLTVSNLSGILMLTRRITGSKTRLDISQLPGGVYFVRVTGNKTVQVGKFVK